MGGVNPDEPLEIAPGVFKRLGDCQGSEVESAIRLIARARIDRAWIDEQASGTDQGGLTIGRRFFANVSDAERDLIAYWQMVKLVEEEKLRPATETDAGPEAMAGEGGAGAMTGERLIDQALATVLAAESPGAEDQSSLTHEQALVWAIYLRATARDRGLASDEDLERSVSAARERGISVQEIEAALAAGDHPGNRERDYPD
jgi:hypothetical protein